MDTKMNTPFPGQQEDPGMEKIRLGISTCLLGENVRYDGGISWIGSLKRLSGNMWNTFPYVLRWNAAFPFQENRCT